jgi:hypothetical protein
LVLSRLGIVFENKHSKALLRKMGYGVSGLLLSERSQPELGLDAPGFWITMYIIINPLKGTLLVGVESYVLASYFCFES